MELRQHQIEIINETRREIASGNKKPLIFAPCSFGKTIVAAEIARLAVEKGNKVLFLLHRRLLAYQTKDKFDDYGLHSSIIMAGYDTDFTAPIMISTVQTYSRRLMLDDPRANTFFHDAEVLFCDEAHLGISQSYKKIYEYYKDKVLIGLTGSPARGDQRGLGEVFSCIVKSIGIGDLTEQGWLVPLRYYAAESPDLSNVRITGGEFNKGDLQKTMNKEKLIGDVLENWLRIGENRPTIVFSSGVKHSRNLKEQFEKAGIPAAHLEAHSPHEERMQVLKDFREGRITVVCNCQLFTEGYDADFVGCIAIARPTKSLPLWIQMVGRGQRIIDGKNDCKILDFGGNIERHGLIDWDREWTLDGTKQAWSKPKREKTVALVKCRACHYVFMGESKCPLCGTIVASFGKKIMTVEAELEELDAKNMKNNTVIDKRRYLGMLKHFVNDRGYNPKMINAKYRSRYDCWPHHTISDVEPIKPDQAFLNLMKYDMIKYRKEKEKDSQRTRERLMYESNMAGACNA